MLFRSGFYLIGRVRTLERQTFSLRRTSPPRPSKPEPNKSSVAGSGTGGTGTIETSTLSTVQLPVSGLQEERRKPIEAISFPVVPAGRPKKAKMSAGRADQVATIFIVSVVFPGVTLTLVIVPLNTSKEPSPSAEPSMAIVFVAVLNVRSNTSVSGSPPLKTGFGETSMPVDEKFGPAL